MDVTRTYECRRVPIALMNGMRNRHVWGWFLTDIKWDRQTLPNQEDRFRVTLTWRWIDLDEELELKINPPVKVKRRDVCRGVSWIDLAEFLWWKMRAKRVG